MWTKLFITIFAGLLVAIATPIILKQIEKQNTHKKKKKYFAFISYKSEDKKWAKWLLRKLEYYHLPATLNGKEVSPKTLRPIFRDVDELAAGDLPEQIKTALKNSKNLIVICSPNVVKSDNWVNKEINEFINMGRVDRIYPFIVKGNSPKDFFPSALLSLSPQQERKGANIHESSKAAALVKIIAGMLGIEFDDLWQRHKRRQRKIRIAICSGVIFLLILIFLACLYLRPTYRYYADYVDKWGVPEGIIELTKEQQQHRHRMYQFEYHRVPIGEPGFFFKKRVTKVRYVNSAHEPQEMSQEVQRSKGGAYPIIKIEYNKENGDAYRWIFCDYKEKVRLRHVLSERDGKKACIADFIAPKEQKGIGFAKAYDNSRARFFVNPYANIVRYAYRRDSNGYITQKTYHCNNDYNLSRSAIHDAGGIYGCSYSIDSLGRNTYVRFKDSNGKLTISWEGVAGTRYKYDEYGNISIVEDIDKRGKAIRGQNDRWISKVNFSDENGNIATTFWYDANNWYRKTTYLYDSRGNMIEEANWDPDGKPTDNSEGWSKTTLKYDKKGNVIEQAFWDKNGEPSEFAGSGLNYSKITYKYDKQGNVIEEVQYNENGAPSFSFYSEAVKIVYQYDDDNNIIKKTYLDAKGKPCMCHGHACSTYKYDYLGNEIECAYLDSNYQPCKFGNYSKVTSKYDDIGNCMEVAFWDTNNRPCLGDGPVGDGLGWYAKLTLKYDDYGNLAEIAYWGTDGKPCTVGGTCRNSFTCDEKGNLTEIIHYDLNGHYTKDIMKYDEKGRKIERTHYNEDGKLCLNSNGHARVTYEYIDGYYSPQETYYDEKGNIIHN